MTDDEIKKWNETKKASRDFGDLPIVIVDIEECLNIQRQEVNKLMAVYSRQPTVENASELYYKIRNNRITTTQWGGEFFPEVDLEEIFKKMQELSNNKTRSISIKEYTKNALSSGVRTETVIQADKQIQESTQQIDGISINGR